MKGPLAPQRIRSKTRIRGGGCPLSASAVAIEGRALNANPFPHASLNHSLGSLGSSGPLLVWPQLDAETRKAATAEDKRASKVETPALGVLQTQTRLTNRTALTNAQVTTHRRAVPRATLPWRPIDIRPTVYTLPPKRVWRYGKLTEAAQRHCDLRFVATNPRSQSIN